MNPLFKPSSHVQKKLELKPEIVFNISGDYHYMSEAYYELVDAELAAESVLPSPEDTLDAYVVPLALEKAKLAGLSVPDANLVIDKLPVGVLAYSVNPFSEKMQMISEEDKENTKLNSLSLAGKYAVLCQVLPNDYRIDIVRCVLGHSLISEYETYALELFKLFTLPLMKVRVIVTPEAYLFSAVEPLALKDLSEAEKSLLESLGTWQE